MKPSALLSISIVLATAAPVVAHHFRYTADLTGAAESPANDSPAIGHVVITIDFDLITMEIATDFSGLVGTVTQAHIHAPTDEPLSGTAGIATQVPTLDSFPTTGTSGSYSHVFDVNQASAYNPPFFAASGVFPSDAFNVLVAALDEGQAYFDIHSTAYPDGEIRGFLAHVPGDYNDNGKVDAADYVLWRHSEGDTGEGLAADSNNDNVIDEDDYSAWRENFGNTRLGSGSSLATGTTVPEPSALVLLAVNLILPRRTRLAE